MALCLSFYGYFKLPLQAAPVWSKKWGKLPPCWSKPFQSIFFFALLPSNGVIFISSGLYATRLGVCSKQWPGVISKNYFETGRKIGYQAGVTGTFSEWIGLVQFPSWQWCSVTQPRETGCQCQHPRSALSGARTGRGNLSFGNIFIVWKYSLFYWQADFYVVLWENHFYGDLKIPLFSLLKSALQIF